ncbi:MAG: helix-turn-helix transcriptional regulator [Ruminiclostridium sp.]|nr:helix-turn-helix transcriptional regulator [Ruminiclostridium sp.]
MNTNQDLNYHLYVQKIHGFRRTPFHTEFEKYMAVRSGNVEVVKRNFAMVRDNFFEGKGTLSDDPVRNMQYHFVTAVALITRVCVEGGLSHDTAYTLSDIYIQKADKCKSCEKLIDLLEEMQVDFAQRMHGLKKENVISLHIRKCIDYIYEHLHENLSIKTIADYFDLNPSYLSKLFLKETGTSIKDFVTEAKISTAENMLKYSDFSYLDISLALGFSSQSAFISVFKKIKGITPKKYKEEYYMSSFGN